MFETHPGIAIFTETLANKMSRFALSFNMDDDTTEREVVFETPGSSNWNSVFSVDASDWIDCLSEMRSNREPLSREGWEVVARVERVEVAKVADPARPPRWCKHGNACPRADCRFRHERCGHYDAWLARGRRGHNCRAIMADPRSVLSPEDGGCKYDHRDPRDLTRTPVPLPVKTEDELWESFFPLGLECRANKCYDFEHMRIGDKEMLIRSLKAANVNFEEFADYINIECEDSGPLVDTSSMLPAGTNDELLSSFGPLGLAVSAEKVDVGTFYEVSAMTGENRAMMMRSLVKQNRDGAICADLRVLYVI